MAITTAPVLIGKPTASMPLRYGIFAAAEGPYDLPIHARSGGLQYVNPLCQEGVLYENECPPSALDSKASFFDAGTETVLGAPFTTIATITCGPVGFDYTEFRAMVLEALKGVEQGLVEEAFSTGDEGQSPSLLAADGILTVTGGGVTVSDVLSELERARYCGFDTNQTHYGPRAIIHVPIPVFNQMKSDHLIEFDGTKWRTAMGTVVSTGCYANNDPDGVAAADGVFWMYITGQTVIWRTPDDQVQIAPVEGSLNRTTNQMMMMAEREWVITYECGGFAKAVTLWP